MKKNEKKQNSKKNISPLVIILFSVLVIYVLSFVALLFWGLLTSVKSYLDFGVPNHNVLGFPTLDESKKFNSVEQFFKLSNYTLVLENFHFKREVSFYSAGKLVTHRADLNFVSLILYTLLYAGVSALIQALVPCIVAYICAKYDFWYCKVVYTTALVVLSVPSVGIYPSEVALLRNLGLYDTFIGTWIQKFGFTGLYFFVFYSYFKGLAGTYSEAAEVDGASQWRTLVSIILPLAIKTLATIYLIKFIEYWNDYQTANLYLPTKPTLAYGIYIMAYSTSDNSLARVPVRIASCMLLAIPMIIIFVVFRNRIMGNVSVGGIKE